MLKLVVDGKELDVENDCKEMTAEELNKLEDKLNKSNNIEFKIEG